MAIISKVIPENMKSAANAITVIDRGFISKSMLELCNISKTPTTMRIIAANNIFKERFSFSIFNAPVNETTFVDYEKDKENTCESKVKL